MKKLLKDVTDEMIEAKFPTRDKKNIGFNFEKIIKFFEIGHPTFHRRNTGFQVTTQGCRAEK